MSEKSTIVPVSLSLTEGDFFTLWAPSWRENGSEWTAFLGDKDQLFVFRSLEELLAFLESDRNHDLKNHPRWQAFASGDATRVVPDQDHELDIIGAPALLADRPGYTTVKEISRIFRVTRALGSVCSADHINVFFASHSVLGNVDRGPEHFSGSAGLSEWSAIGRAVLDNWRAVVTDLDDAITVVDVEPDAVDAAKTKIESDTEAAKQARELTEQQKQAEEGKADPYDSSPWAAAGIDPVRISINGRTLYTLRTYVDKAPVFLGRYGEIFTFPNSKSLARWIADHQEHSLAKLSTWEDLLTLAKAGELDVTVHPDNSYSFTGLVKDIESGPDNVDTTQLERAYELMADAADWAEDDSLNSYFLSNPRMQDYISYMVGSTGTSGYVPSAPYTDHAEGWQDLENMLTKRFSKS
ncbi:hypothetical protein GP475_02930 [Corynebacterium poyangense]|uniref:Primosomal protein n=1 Tax=Corynebacterium poyangense TaxID=2684405 RepID=A0A7H0SME0_9CORY|nr:hypothetical protein [Corynebacterium poyangense]QNQ89715.1 hypothetical protein GP475_02930 [Corynebacterium poyangense]